VTWDLAPALVSGVAGLAGGLVMPAVLARLPEPEPDPGPQPDGAVDGLVPAVNEAEFARPVDEPKELYAAMAARRGVRVGIVVASTLVAALVGARIGWSWSLLFLVYLVPVGVTLAVVDWRTRYLPTRLIGPSYVVVGVLAVVASALASDWLSLRSAAIGWVGCFVVFFLMWFVSPRAMAYGDVRLAGLLGLAVGWEGVAQVVIGMFTAFLLLAVVGTLLSVVRVFHRRHTPFGPFLLVGALLGVAFPLQVLNGYAAVVNGVVSLFA
jgi:leader peptidase (prepilin peptidase) / N-methyltransferase